MKFAQALLFFQTLVGPQQLKVPEIVNVVTCQGKGTNTAGGAWDCTGIMAFSIKLPSGQIVGPYIGLPVPPPAPGLSWVPVN